MIKNSIKDKHTTMLTRRFKQAVSVTIIMVLMATASSFFFNESTFLKACLILDVVIMIALFPLITREKINLAKQIYFWSNFFALSFIFWSQGGLLSSAVILVYPMFLMISALVVGPRTFLTAYVSIVALMIFISVSAINSYTNYNFNQFGYWDLSIVLILLSASGFTAWRFNNDMRYALKKLKNEIINVKQSRNEIERLIHFDSLTGLSSRLNTKQQFDDLKSNLDKTLYQVAFVFIDIDNFKAINDYYSHSTGDEVLKQVAKRLTGVINKRDIACRLSGDEFLLIMTRPENYDIEQLSKRILDDVSQPVEVSEHHVEITASLGIAIYDSRKDKNFESVLKRADLAMDRAKQLGKNKYSFYDEELFLQSTKKLRIIKGLKAALENDDLELFLQPKVNIHTGKIQSTEALLRWVRNNPENISPVEFIPLIESTELICNVGEWVIKKACILCKELHNKGFEKISISVNISSTQFVMGGLEKIIIRELQESQLDPKYLELELTEHILFQDDKAVLEELKRIKELGVTLSIDDFGTGYSNLGYLTKFKVDTLKIDRSFITNINTSSDNFAIVDAIIKMAKTLGLKVVAEGVETQQEWDVLKQLGCDQGQGYIWSRPLPTLDFQRHLSVSTQT